MTTTAIDTTATDTADTDSYSNDATRNGASTTRRPAKDIVAVVSRGKGKGQRNYWTRIGAAFANADGSLNLRFDYLPTSADTTIQLRDPKER